MAIKKALFSKPAWAAKATTTVEDDQPIFQQNIYEDILEANRKNEEKRLAKQRQKENRKSKERRSQSHDTQVDDDEKAVKKRRISTEPIRLDKDEDDDFEKEGHTSDSGSSRSPRSDTSGRKRDQTSQKHNERRVLNSPPKDAKRYGYGERARDKPSQARSKQPVLADDDDDIAIVDVQSLPNKPRAKPKPPPPPESDSDADEDEYVKELKRQARANARAVRSNGLTSLRRDPLDEHGHQPSAYITQPGLPQSDANNSKNTTPDLETLIPAVEDPSDPEVQIWITSIIPNCKEVIIKRRASQPLDKVLDFYVARNELRPDLASKIFFTWNGMRLYKSTTMRGILVNIKAKHGTKADGSDLAEGKISLEAVTDEVYAHRQRQKERQKQLLERGSENDAGESNDTAATAASMGTGTTGLDPVQPEPEQPQKVEGLILALRSQDESALPNMNLRVRPDTTIERIVNGYKRKKGIDLNKQVYLVFDGDRLEAQQTVDEIGFEEGDTVDVRSK